MYGNKMSDGDRHNDEPPCTTNNMVEAMYKDLTKTICIDIVSGVYKDGEEWPAAIASTDFAQQCL